MAATARIKGILEVQGLGQDVSFPFNADTSVAPTVKQYGYREQAVADTAEVLDLGGVTTVHMLVIHAAANALLVDLDFSSVFDSDMEIPAGEVAVIPKPAGVVYIKNATAVEQTTYEYYAVGV